eukprot:g12109.t1
MKYQFTVDITLGHTDFAWPRTENHVPSLGQMCICLGIIRTGYLCEHMAWVALNCNIDPNSIIMQWRTVEAYQQTYAIPPAISKPCLPENDTELATLVNSEEDQAKLQETLRCLSEGVQVPVLPEELEKGKWNKKKKVTRCSRCHSTEHNARTCKEAVASTQDT